MAFEKDNFNCVVSNVAGPKLYTYLTTDLSDDMDTENYFNDAADLGLAEGDLILSSNAGANVASLLMVSSNTGGVVDTFDAFELTQNSNKFYLTVRIPDISTADTIYVATTTTCNLVAASSVIDGAISGGNAVLTIANATTATTIGTITIAHSGSAAGDIDTMSITGATQTNSAAISIATDGGSTGTVSALVTLEFKAKSTLDSD